MEIICDTSFLIALVSNPIKCLDKVESEIGKLKFIVPTFVLDELDLIEKKSGPKKSMVANTAIRISKLKFEIKDIGKSKNVDKDILNYATRNKRFGVATLDGKLLNRLKMAEVTTITLSKNKMIIANRYFEG
ncbi:MAG: PIN domain-containing protein [Nitrososphaeraceae archaeon]|jgi:rRNA-processing protein FCF1